MSAPAAYCGYIHVSRLPTTLIYILAFSYALLEYEITSPDASTSQAVTHNGAQAKAQKFTR